MLLLNNNSIIAFQIAPRTGTRERVTWDRMSTNLSFETRWDIRRVQMSWPNAAGTSGFPYTGRVERERARRLFEIKCKWHVDLLHGVLVYVCWLVRRSRLHYKKMYSILKENNKTQHIQAFLRSKINTSLTHYLVYILHLTFSLSLLLSLMLSRPFDRLPTWGLS